MRKGLRLVPGSRLPFLTMLHDCGPKLVETGPRLVRDLPLGRLRCLRALHAPRTPSWGYYHTNRSCSGGRSWSWIGSTQYGRANSAKSDMGLQHRAASYERD